MDATDVQAALERRNELTIRELLAWKDGEFAFSRDGEREQGGPELSVEVDRRWCCSTSSRSWTSAAALPRLPEPSASRSTP